MCFWGWLGGDPQDFRDSGENPLNSVNFSTDSEGPISSWRPSSVPKGGVSGCIFSSLLLLPNTCLTMYPGPPSDVQEDTDNADQAAAVEKWGVSESTTKAEQEEKVVSEIEEEDDEEEEEEDEEDEEEDADQESPSKGSDAAGQMFDHLFCLRFFLQENAVASHGWSRSSVCGGACMVAGSPQRPSPCTRMAALRRNQWMKLRIALRWMGATPRMTLPVQLSPHPFLRDQQGSCLQWVCTVFFWCI